MRCSTRWRLAVLALAGLVAGSCASSGTGPGTLGGWLGGGSRLDAGDPWTLPEAAYPTQRLFRVRYDGPQGRLGFKLTLYLEGEVRFLMRAADNVGRRIWELGVDENDEALWLDHRNKRYCVAAGASRVAVVPLARLPLASLPRLLLGHLPAPPVSDLQVTQESVYYRDVLGRLWNGGITDGKLDWWTQVDGGRAVSWWRREGEESIFVDLRGERQLRWREVVREPLAASPGPLEIPKKYTVADCG